MFHLSLVEGYFWDSHSSLLKLLPGPEKIVPEGKLRGHREQLWGGRLEEQRRHFRRRLTESVQTAQRLSGKGCIRKQAEWWGRAGGTLLPWTLLHSLNFVMCMYLPASRKTRWYLVSKSSPCRNDCKANKHFSRACGC